MQTMDLMPIILTTTVASRQIHAAIRLLAIHTALQLHVIPAVLLLATHAALHLAILAGQRAVYG